MQVENLRPEDVSELEDKISELKKTNPDITHKVFEMQKALEAEEAKPVQHQLDELTEAVRKIHTTLKDIRDGHILTPPQLSTPPEEE